MRWTWIEVLHDLQVRDTGVTAHEAEERLQRFGPNQLEEARPIGFLTVLWEQLNNFVVILLIVASAVSGLLGEWIDASAILAIVVLNTVLGIVQEQRAEEALAALKRLAAPEAQVLRDGHRTVDTRPRNLVPGDIVFLEAGNYVPADVRLLEAVNLRIEEASLTGESLPVQEELRHRPGSGVCRWVIARTRPSWARSSPTDAGAASSPAPACTPSSA